MKEKSLRFLVSASGFELERIKTALSDNGIPNDSKAQKKSFSAKAVTGIDNSEQDIYVSEDDYEKAYDLCIGIGAIRPEGEVQEIITDDEAASAEGQKIMTDDEAASAEVQETVTDDEAAPAEEEFEDMPEGKRAAVRIISAILFLLIAAAVIFGTDAITGWIKSLFQ